MKFKSIIFISLAAIVFLTWQNNAIVVSKHNYINNKILKNFSGFKILHISDFHNKNFHGKLISKIVEINPDIIVITGDLIDRRKTDLNVAEEFIKSITKIAKTYYVSGNHEQLSIHYTKLKEILYKHGVVNLDDKYIKINNRDKKIGITGVAAPVLLRGDKEENNNDKHIKKILQKLTENSNTNFNILLAHRPEQIHIYKEFDFDLVFSGHAHGGQIRIPFIGGILSPDQGLFPKYSQGIHKEGPTSMVVSRGLGNSLFPFRIFNRPELVVVELKNE